MKSNRPASSVSGVQIIFTIYEAELLLKEKAIKQSVSQYSHRGGTIHNPAFQQEIQLDLLDTLALSKTFSELSYKYNLFKNLGFVVSSTSVFKCLSLKDLSFLCHGHVSKTKPYFLSFRGLQQRKSM